MPSSDSRRCRPAVGRRSAHALQVGLLAFERHRANHPEDVPLLLAGLGRARQRVARQRRSGAEVLALAGEIRARGIESVVVDTESRLDAAWASADRSARRSVRPYLPLEQLRAGDLIAATHARRWRGPDEHTRMIGLVVGGVASGVGKTTLTLGLIGALRRRGLTVQPFKVGPDYIDPSQHAQAAGRPSRNLDSWLLPELRCAICLHGRARRPTWRSSKASWGCSTGGLGPARSGAPPHVAKLLGLPVLLVVDAAKAARSRRGRRARLPQPRPDLRIVGVVLNNVASESHAAPASEADRTRGAACPCSGGCPATQSFARRSGYLGLVPAGRAAPSGGTGSNGRRPMSNAHLDLDRLLRIASVSTPASAADRPLPEQTSRATRARIGVAQDAAFSFYYQDSLDLLTAWGAELVPFSPLARPSASARH